MPSSMVIQMPLIYNADDPEDEDAYEADPALSYDDENPDDEKMKWKLTMQKLTRLP